VQRLNSNEKRIDVTVYVHNDDESILVARIKSNAKELPDNYSIELSLSSIKVRVFPHKNILSFRGY
jgi:DUF1365 family protein